MPASRSDRLPRRLLPGWLTRFTAERLDVESPVYRMTDPDGEDVPYVVKQPRCLLGRRPGILSVGTWQLGGGWVLQYAVETDHQKLALTALRQIARRNQVDLQEIDFVSENCGWLGARPVLFDW